MSTITVIGGTGYAGTAIVANAARRGHDVISFSRSLPEQQVPGVRYETGSVLTDHDRVRAVKGSDVVISALSPRGELDGQLLGVDQALAETARSFGVRFGVVGGFSSLRPAHDAPRFADGDNIPEEFAAEARQMNAIREMLLTTPSDLDWVYFAPAGQFGAFAPGEALGHYRTSDDVALFDEDGNSAISGADFALAIVDEIETPQRHRGVLSVAY